MPRQNNRLLHRLLGLLFLAAAAYQSGFSVSSILFRRLYNVHVVRPFQMKLDSDRFLGLSDALSGADIHQGDELLEVEGLPYQSSSQLVKILAAKKSR